MRPGNRIAIFEKNILITSEKNYYYELVSSQNDVTLFKSIKKMQFLEELGYSLLRDPELSLHSYLSLAQTLESDS